MDNITPQLSLTESFMTSWMSLQGSEIKLVSDALEKFKREPTSPGLNYESLNVKTKGLHSIRAGRDIRCIVLKAEKDEKSHYFFLYTDHHDKAYDWAERRKCGVNAYTGAISVIEEEVQPEADEENTYIPTNLPVDSFGVFESFSKSDLLSIGVEEDKLELVRSLKEEEELIKLERRFSKHTYNALYDLACGDEYENVLITYGFRKVDEKQFDEEDFIGVLNLDVNKFDIFTAENDAEFEKMLNAPMDRWRVFLHPSQRSLVKAHFNGPVRVLGGAGTGKTVVAMHRAKHLARQLIELKKTDQKILFTTYTTSLVNDIKNNLSKICDFDELKLIEVRGLDSEVRRILKEENYNKSLDYTSNQYKELWQNAMTYNKSSLDEQFIKDEWTHVIQANGIEDEKSYVRVARPGRGKQLSRLLRGQLWSIFKEYRNLLNENNLMEFTDSYRAAKVLITEKRQAPFAHVIADEIQDFPPEAFRFLRVLAPTDGPLKNDLFLVGDGHQNLYGHHIILSKTGINIRGRGRKLRINYRTPDKTRYWATSILEQVEVTDLDGNSDDSKGYRSIIKGVAPSFVEIKNKADEVAYLAEYYKHLKAERPKDLICVAVATNNARTELANTLSKKGMMTHQLDNKNADITDEEPMRISTMHRLKGLEFDHVILSSSCKVSLKQEKGTLEERCLIHVAATRCKKTLTIIRG